MNIFAHKSRKASYTKTFSFYKRSGSFGTERKKLLKRQKIKLKNSNQQELKRKIRHRISVCTIKNRRNPYICANHLFNIEKTLVNLTKSTKEKLSETTKWVKKNKKEKKILEKLEEVQYNKDTKTIKLSIGEKRMKTLRRRQDSE